MIHSPRKWRDGRKGASAVQIQEATVADAAAVARVHLTSWCQTYRGLIPTETYVALSFDERHAHWATVLAAGGPECVYVAKDHDGAICGIASGGPCRVHDLADAAFTGELYVLHVSATAQRQGTGRALVRAVAQRLADDGMFSMLVWVLRENGGARRFYKALGGQFVRETTADFMGALTPDTAYGWADTAILREE